MDFLSELRSLSTLIEVAVLWVALYAIMRFLRKTRGFGLLRGEFRADVRNMRQHTRGQRGST